MSALIRPYRATGTAGRSRRAAAVVVALMASGLTGLGASPAAAATTVTTEARLRAAFANPDETEITLGADISLEDCSDDGGHLARNSATNLAVRGRANDRLP